jgi:hypothetical protein
MSPQSSADNSGRKQSLNIYTTMLLLSFIALTIGAILMFMELQRYGNWPQWKTSQIDRPTIDVVKVVTPNDTFLV